MQVNLTTLSNGLRVLTVERPQTETVSLGIWVNTGSAYETEDINGISHFIEHMVFKGTQKRNALQISEDIENVGGNTNAYTSREITLFYAKMLKDDAELALDVLADFVMAPSFLPNEMDKEKEVVVQEIKQTKDDPSDIVFDYFQATAFKNQSLGMSILGPVERVRSFSAEDLRNYMHGHYAGENIVVAAVGNIKHDDFVKMTEARMGSLNGKVSFSRAKQIYTGGEYIKSRDIEQAQVLLGFPGIDYFSDKYYSTGIMSNILGGSMSSRLFQEIREKRGLVYSVYSFTNSHSNSGLFGIYAGLDEEEICKYVPVVADEVKKICNEYVTDQELNRVRMQMKAGILMALESSSSTAEIIARQHLVHNRIIPMQEIVERIENVSKQDIMDTAQSIFSGKLTYTVLGNIKCLPNYEEVEKLFR